MYIVYFFVLGAVLGSFYNVVGLRIPKGQSIVTPRSHCTACQKTLTGIELIPVFSYFVQRGRCKGCGARFSPVYMLTELLTGLLFAFSYYTLGFSLELLVALLFISLLACIVVSDLAYMLIPNKILLFFLPLLVLGRLLSPLAPWWDSLAGAGAGFTVLLLIAVISNGGMGGGDIKLFFLVGLVLGTVGTLLTLALASVIGILFSVVLPKQKVEGEKIPIPFGPAIAVAALIVYFYGDALIGWYMQLF